MHYELYVDSLFLVNFGMNLYLLLLVNRSLFRTATRGRMILGAVIGATFYLLQFLGVGPIWLKLLLGPVAGSVVMVVVTFQVRSIRAFFRVSEKLLLYSLIMGGIMLLIIKNIPWLGSRIVGIWGILGMGALLYLLLGYRMERKERQSYQCRVTLAGTKNKLKVTALVDSGNSLVEPISGKPVSIVDKTVFDKLWEEEPELYRAIPYHSIGKNRGVLRGYLLPEIRIETEGVTKVCKDIYIAVCEEYLTADEKMILNPGILVEPEEKQKRRKRVSNRNKERYGCRYDIKGGSSG